MVSEHQFLRLFAEHKPHLRAFAHALTLQAGEADDLLQDACVQMWQKLGQLKVEADFRAWACSFLRFNAMNRRRKNSRSPVSFSAEFVDQLAAENEAEADLADAERTALQGCLEELTPMQQGLVRQYYAKADVTIADLSNELQRPAAGLYKTLQRVREALRACIGARLREEGYSHSLTS
ncbi:MAG: sigma-70 family RNA polymerase sigma factor [Verrucomicrobiota bacterium]